MVYQIGKEAGAMAAVLEGKVDAVLLTGGMAHSDRLVTRLRGYVEWIARVASIPARTSCGRWPKACFASSMARKWRSGCRDLPLKILV